MMRDTNARSADAVSAFPMLDRFSQVVDSGRYAPIPDDWTIGVSDVVDSSGAIRAGRYKAVNLAGAGTISAVRNAMAGELKLFVFAGDGARFVVPPQYARQASDALARVAMWAQRDLDLELRVGTIGVAAARSAGFDVRAAFWQASKQVRYAVFDGGGLEWAESELKAGRIGLAAAQLDDEPDLTGLSCQWAPVRSQLGTIISLIVKPAPSASGARFAGVINGFVALLESAECRNPVPDSGPAARWSSAGVRLQSRIARKRRTRWWRFLRVLASAPLLLAAFRFGLRLGRFDPDAYRREIFENSDFRKFDDGLMITMDCAPEVADHLERLLVRAEQEGVIRYGMHRQEQALVTCVVPSVTTSDHMHFVDGADGGYASAARQIRR